jgi:type I restriction enzyme S subunit
MSEWKKVKLGELYEVHNGLSKGRQFFGTGFPFLTFSNVFNNWFLPEQLESLVQTTDKEREACSIKAGDVFITRTSETMDELGMSSVALRDYPNATYNGFTKRLRPITDDVIPEYIGYYLRSPKFRGKFMAFSTMTTRASLANGDLLGMEVELPSKEKQHCIASILSRYDSLIENYQKQIKLLEAAQRLYKEWFVDLHFPGHENTKITDGVPEGWEKKIIADVCTNISSGSTPSRSNKAYWENGTIKWVKTKELQDGWILDTEEYISQEGYNSSSTKMFPVNTILMAIYASPTLGRLGILSTDCCCNQAALGLIADENIISWQWLFWKLYELRDEFNAIARGAGQQNISGIVVKNKEIMIPDKGAIDGFTSVVSKMFDQQKSLSSQIRLLTEARDRLLPKLMSGDIEI